MVRRKFLVGSVVALTLLVASCGQKTDIEKGVGNSATQTVAFGTFSLAIDYSPYIVAREKGWFDEALRPFNATATYTSFEELPAINEALASNRLDVIFEAEPPVIIGRSVGIDVRVTNISCTLPVDILVPLDSPIENLNQLENSEIAVLAGTSSHYGVLVNARSVGLADDTLNIIDMPPLEAKAAFDSGQVDAWAIWPPFVEQSILAGNGRTLTGGNASIHSIMAMRGSFIDENPEMASAISDVLEDAKDWVEANPEDAITTVAKAANLDRRVVELAWDKHDWNVEITSEISNDFQLISDFLLEKDLIRTQLNVAEDLISPLTDKGG